MWTLSPVCVRVCVGGGQTKKKVISCTLNKSNVEHTHEQRLNGEQRAEIVQHCYMLGV